MGLVTMWYEGITVRPRISRIIKQMKKIVNFGNVFIASIELKIGKIEEIGEIREIEKELGVFNLCILFIINYLLSSLTYFSLFIIHYSLSITFSFHFFGIFGYLQGLNDIIDLALYDFVEAVHGEIYAVIRHSILRIIVSADFV